LGAYQSLRAHSTQVGLPDQKFLVG
jgi:hypothetical protein